MTLQELVDNIKMELGVEAPTESAPELEKRIHSNIKLVSAALQDEEDWFPFKEERSFTITTSTSYNFDDDIMEMLYASTTDGEILILTPEVLRNKYPDPTNDITSFICIVPNYRTHTFSAYKASSDTLTVYCRVRGDTADLLSIGGGFAKLIKYGVLKEMSDAGSTNRTTYNSDYRQKLEELKAKDAQREYDSEFDMKPPEWVINFQKARQDIKVV